MASGAEPLNQTGSGSGPRRGVWVMGAEPPSLKNLKHKDVRIAGLPTKKKIIKHISAQGGTTHQNIIFKHNVVRGGNQVEVRERGPG